MNYYKRHLGDYAKDTAHLSMLEEGAYTRLLDYYYTIEAALPLDRSDVYRRLRAISKQEKAAVDACLRDFFKETPEGFRHTRCDAEIERMRHQAETNRVTGKKGGRPKKETESVSESNRNETKTKPEGFQEKTLAISHKPLAISQEPIQSQKHGADAPTEAADATPEKPDFVAQVFSDGVSLLVASGEKESDARSLLGKLRKKHGDDGALRIITAARGTSSPKEYIAATFRAKGSVLNL